MKRLPGGRTDTPATIQLDTSQEQFCQAPERNVRLLAPAGCGKTLCLLYRCMHLVDRPGAARHRFLLVTFTRAARDELLTRLNEAPELAHLRDQVEISTLNSWGYRRIRNVAYSPKLIVSKKDLFFAMKNQLQGIWQRHERIKHAIMGRKSWRRNESPRVLMNTLDEFKSLGFDHIRHTDFASFSKQWDALEEMGLGWRMEQHIHELSKIEVLDGNDRHEDAAPLRQRVHDDFFVFWREAARHLADSSMFTLEDQKYFAFQDELRNIEAGRMLSGAASYDHVVVDEFQDINPLDLALTKAIMDRNRASITIAGDDDQAIFEWRGATPEYILDPERYLEVEFATYVLGVNYRSPKNVVDHSQRLIAHNRRRVPKAIRARSRANAKIEVVAVGGLTEALGCVDEIVDTTNRSGDSPDRIALISRKRSQIIPYQIFFASRDLPFCAAEDLQVFLSDAFDRLLELLTIKATSNDSKRPATIMKELIYLCEFVKRYRLSKANRDALRRHLRAVRPSSMSAGISAIADYRGELKGKNPGGIVSLAMAEAILEFVESRTVSSTLIALSDTFEGLHRDFGKSEDDIFYADPPFFQLAEYATRYGTDYDAFLDDIELAKETLVRVPPLEDQSVDERFRRPLHLMTALRAKGKEFDKVILLDVEADMWPNKNARTPEQLEQERRVFYVGFTRARREIVLLRNKGATASPYIQELGL